MLPTITTLISKILSVIIDGYVFRLTAVDFFFHSVHFLSPKLIFSYLQSSTTFRTTNRNVHKNCVNQKHARGSWNMKVIDYCVPYKKLLLPRWIPIQGILSPPPPSPPYHRVADAMLHACVFIDTGSWSLKMDVRFSIDSSKLDRVS